MSAADPAGAARREPLGRGLVTLFALQVASGILVAPLFTLYPVFVEKSLGLPPAYSAWVRVLFICSGGVTALVGGAACDLLGRRRAYLLAMTGVCAAGLLFLIGDSPWVVPIALYGGVMFGLGTVAGLTAVTELSPPGSLGFATALYFLTGTIGNALGSPIAGWIARDVPYGYGLMGMAMAGGHAFLIAAAGVLLPPIPSPEVPRSLGEVAGGYGRRFGRGAVWALLGVRFLVTIYWGAVTLLMPLLLFRLTHSEVPPGLYAGASLLAAGAAQLAMGRIVDRRGAARPAVVAALLVTLAALGQWLFAGSAVGLSLFGLLGAAAAWGLSVTMTSLVRWLTDETARARLLGLTHLAWSAGFLAGSVLAGLLAGPGQHAPLALLACAGCCAGGALCAALVGRGRPCG